MKQILLGIAMLIFFSCNCLAQTGKNELSIGAEANFLASNGYSSYYNVGIGGNLKGLYGIGDAGQISLSGGYSSFSGKSVAQGQTLSLIPLQAGFRYNFQQGLYLEPQIGIGILTTKYSGGSFTQTNFGGSINAGYVVNGFDFSIRYYTEGDVVSLFAVRLAYDFSLGGKSAK